MKTITIKLTEDELKTLEHSLDFARMHSNINWQRYSEAKTAMDNKIISTPETNGGGI